MTQERKLLAIPADWPQPQFALGETVYDMADKEKHGCPVPGQVLGAVFHATTRKVWGYVVAWEGYGDSEYNEDRLTREAWEYTEAPLPAYQASKLMYSYPPSDDFDPFLDGDDLP